jgi:hypothetical protein
MTEPGSRVRIKPGVSPWFSGHEGVVKHEEWNGVLGVAIQFEGREYGPFRFLRHELNDLQTAKEET